MNNQILCLGLNDQFGISGVEQIKLFKKTGFEAFFINMTKNADIDILAKTAKDENMIIQSVHAPFGMCADLWGEGTDEEIEEGIKTLLECVRTCAEYEVPIMVSHTYIGFDKCSEPNAEGLFRYGLIVKEAEKYGVNIAFENTEGEEYLDALMKEFGSSANVGFCLDTGHEMCYNRRKDLLSIYGDKLIATHINDNLGIKDYSGKITFLDDLHLLPFDGICDWDNLAARLDKIDYEGIMTFELNTKSKPGRHENDIYDNMPIELYISEAYKRACRVAAKRRNNKGE